jgi:hypothetical protein
MSPAAAEGVTAVTPSPVSLPADAAAAARLRRRTHRVNHGGVLVPPGDAAVTSGDSEVPGDSGMMSWCASLPPLPPPRRGDSAVSLIWMPSSSESAAVLPTLRGDCTALTRLLKVDRMGEGGRRVLLLLWAPAAAPATAEGTTPVAPPTPLLLLPPG